VRLRKKPWIAESIGQYEAFVYKNMEQPVQGKWNEIFGTQALLHIELGTGKGQFISETASLNPGIHYVGIEAQMGVLYYAAKKVAERELTNIRLMVLDAGQVTEAFAAGEVDRLYINFCDPWPKKRHAKRRLTHVRFLDKYRQIIKPGGALFFKTDNKDLFDFSLEQFAECGLIAGKITYDLHNSPYAQDNIMTEYERKFSEKGVKINRCEVLFP
jgi:tRNA (guanine-N7-)-methyltransferase